MILPPQPIKKVKELVTVDGMVATQFKGMDHMRQLKAEARQMWKELGNYQGLWFDCIEATLKLHRIKMSQQKENYESIQQQHFWREMEMFGH